MDRRRQRRGQADAAVAVPRAVDFDGGKEERQRGRRHDVIDPQRAHLALALRPLPRRHRAILARLHPGDRLAGGVARRGQRERAQPPGAQAGVDAVDRAVGGGVQLALEHFAAAAWCRPCSSPACSGDLPPVSSRPPQRTARHIRSWSTRNTCVDAQVAPHLGQLVELLDERLLPRGDERRVDARRPRRRSGFRGWPSGNCAREILQHADLVRAARAATTQHEAQAPRIGQRLHI